eukprot:TRINITY_DN6227_c0_g1_i5.p2 TRINITY_DN6227_c0_g1~~TRINITY_DN6227_c0_g1_i5.p2  ORF type:complete len:214 (+),score=58.72 TRINITY_DN6227_c0_g1_i5:159-800(+)
MGNKGSKKSKGESSSAAASSSSSSSSSSAPAAPTELKFTDRFRAVHQWATKHGYVSGFPTFQQHAGDDGSIYGAVVIKAGCGEVRELPASALNNEAAAPARFRAVHEYALANGFSGAFLTFNDGGSTDAPTYGVCLMKEGMAEVQLVETSVIGNKAEQRFSDGHKWAQGKDDIVSAFQNFKTVQDEGGNKQYELVVFKSAGAEHVEIPLKDLI